ncbi:MAG: hypothetical protein FD161_3578 [Limisphaerales bacterium]|nr:MAG: hypothetical protein FD161_3578 [Limisphaerales bacterium]KAG0507576.1 MAG: hypothetical protein E1N63_3244 [Limisphaerales bacterium]TXT48541.1 MAG: hypothetical protein FD140_3619 [Limisphaerales bacterium]
MLSDDQLIAYLAGKLSAEERARVEAELAGDPEALRRLLDQERLDTSLKLLLNPAASRERVKASVLAGIRTATHEVSADEVMKKVLLESGKNALEYRAPKDENAPGLLAALAGAFREWLQTNHARVVVYGGLAALLVFIASEVRISQVRKLTAQQQANTFESSKGGQGLLTQSLSAPRNPAQWPFAADSVWNTPIGSGAQFATVQPGGMDLATGVMVVNASLSHPVLYASASDPVGNLHVPGMSVPFATAPLPAALGTTPGGRHVFLVLPDGMTVLEIHSPRRTGADVRANSIVRADLRGPGVPPAYHSATGSGLSPLGGSIRRGELKAGIPHVIGAVAPLEAVTLKADGTAHVWPADGSAAGDANAAAQMARAGNVHVGSLLAIPPGVDIAKFAAPGTPAHAIARAMQDYGVLVKDTFDGTYFAEWQREGAPHLIFCIEDLFNGDAPRDLARQLAPALRELRVVANHGPNSLGGGGRRRRPVAPDFGKP